MPENARALTELTTGRTGGRTRASASPIGVFVVRHWLEVALVLVLAVAFGLRAAAYLEAPRSLEGAGLTAQQGEIARNIVDHGTWFVVNREAYELLKRRQAEQQILVDPESVDFSRVDRESKAEPVVDQMPGLGVVLAGVWWVTGSKTYAPIQWLQILLDTAMVLLVFWIGVRLTRSTSVGLIAASLYALWPGAIVVAKRPMLDTWAGFFTIACVAAFIWARDHPTSRWRLVLLGFLTGVGIYFRPFIALLPIALALVATPGGGWRRRIVWMSAPTAVALLVLTPWTIRNYVEFDRFIPTRTGLGQAVFEGVGEVYSDEEAASHVEENRPNVEYGSPAYDDFLLGGAARAIVDDPGWYLRLIGERARFLLPCLLAVLVWRRWGRSAALIPVAAAAATIVPYLFIGGDTRFYLPAAFAYLILFAMAIGVAAALAAPRLRNRRPSLRS
jgi:4-amino-4-deoxy-L-arabinose transferase-like glycosyltransferase